jgi:predicted dehydrogenase
MARLRAAVIGAGWYAAENHIPTLASRSEVVLDSVCRIGSEQLARVRDAFGFAFASEDHRECLARSPEIAIVASPHALHFEHAMAALESGAHVLVEKPMTLDPAEAWGLATRARTLGRHLVVANGYHYLPHLSGLRKVITEKLGPLEHVACSFVSATRPVFEGDVGFRRWRSSFFRPDRSTWQDPKGGGGFAYGQLSHSVALALWMTGLKPVAAQARTYAPDGIDLADAATLLFEGGAVGSFGGAAGMPEGRRGMMRLVLVGREGLMEIELDRDRCAWCLHPGGEGSLDIAAGDWAYHCRGPVHALVDLAVGRGENLSPGEIGASTVGVLRAMLDSAASGGVPVAVSGNNHEPR